MMDSCKSNEDKYRELKRILKSMGRVMVAFSGGVDSTLLLKVARDVLKEKDAVVAATVISETTAQHERVETGRLAGIFGVRLLRIEICELDLPAFTRNFPDKCYICKKRRFGELLNLAQMHGFDYVVDGGNLDDQKDFRQNGE